MHRSRAWGGMVHLRCTLRACITPRPIFALPGESRDPGRQELAHVALGPGFRRDERSEGRGDSHRLSLCTEQPGFSGQARE